MAITWDEVPESQLEEFGPDTVRAVRGGTVYDVPVAVGDTADDFLFKVRRILAAGGAAYNSPHPRFPNAFLKRIQIYGAASDAAAFRLVYEPFASAVNSMLQVSSTHRKCLIVTDRVPGTGAMLRVSLDLPDEPNVIPEDLLKVGVLRSQRVISVYRINIGTLPLEAITGEVEVHGTIVNPAATGVTEGPGEIIDCVNQGIWCGRKTGAWRIDADETVVSRYGGYWTHQLAAIAAGRKDEVWDTVGVLQSSTTGKYAMSQAIADLIAADVSLPYKFGIISAPSSNATSYTVPGTDIQITLGGKFDKGFIRAGMYPTVNFAPIFGFGAPNTVFGGNVTNPNPAT